MTYCAARRSILLLLVIVLVVINTAWAVAAEKISPKELLYDSHELESGNRYALKSSNKKNHYFWYYNKNRCEATLNKDIVAVDCKGDEPIFTLSQDGTDVVIKADGEIINTSREGFVLNLMYWAIINHDAKK